MRRHILKAYKVFDAVEIDTAQDYFSEITDTDQVDRVTYQVGWAGTPDGSLAVQVSEDKESWQDLEFGSSILIDNTEDNHRIEITEKTFKFIRLKYTHASGVGVLNASIKGVVGGA